MFEAYKLNKKIKLLDKQTQVQEFELTTKRNDFALHQIEEATNQVFVDRDLLNGWYVVGQGGVENAEAQTSMQVSAFKLYHTNLHARNIIRTLTKFTFGKGPTIIPEDDDPNGDVLDNWKHFKKINKWNLKEKELGTRTFRDGETFSRIFRDEDSKDVFVRFVRPTEIKNPTAKRLPANTTQGIQTDPDDVETIISYYRTDSQGNLIARIMADDMIHVKIFADSDQKRGTSILSVCAKTLREYEGWLQDRIYLNKVRSAIALIRKVPGSAANVKGIRDENSGDESSKVQKAMRGGTIITASKGITYEMLSHNINASDVKDDGRAMLLSISAAVGFPEQIFTADYSNANYSSSLIAQNPFVREIEDWQDFFDTYYKQVFEIVTQHAVDQGDLPEGTNTECNISWPPMISADLETIAKAFEILFRFKVVSKRTWMEKMGLNPETEFLGIEEDDEDLMVNPIIPGQPGGPSGTFRLPLSPVNQFSAVGLASELKKLVGEKDPDGILEIIEEYLSDDVDMDKLDEQIAQERKDEKDKIQREHEKELKQMELEAAKEMKPEIHVDVTQITIPVVEKQAGDVTIQPQKIDIDAKTTIEATEINIKNEPPVINAPEIKIDNITNIPDTNITVEQPNIQIENKVDVPETQVNITNELPEQKPAEITIENKIEPQEVPTINIENKIDVPETNITIENKIEKEEKKTIKKTVQRDEEGNVVGIIETQED